MRVIDPDILKREIEIVWLVPTARRLPFVREALCAQRQVAGRLPPFKAAGDVIAYARMRWVERREVVPFRGFGFRIWAIRPGDLASYCDPDGFVRHCPLEGVDPVALAPGVASKPAAELLQAAPWRASVAWLPAQEPARLKRIVDSDRVPDAERTLLAIFSNGPRLVRPARRRRR